MRKAKLTERRIQHRPDMIGVGAGQRLAAQQIAAVRIRDRQRLTALAVAGQKPALEVDAPHLVGRFAMRKGSARGRTATAQPALHGQPFAIEQRSDRARDRPSRGGRPMLQPGTNLQRPPARVPASHRKAAFGDLIRNRMRMMQRCPRAIQQACNAGFPVTRKPFVPNPPAHAEAPAQPGKRFLLLLRRNHKSHPLFHGTGLRPSHRQGPPCRSVDLLPMSSVYSVTYVAGQDPLHLSPLAGRGGSYPASTWPSISAMVLTPHNPMVTLSSLRMMSIAFATPASPPAPSPCAKARPIMQDLAP